MRDAGEMTNREINLIVAFITGWLIGMATCRFVVDAIELLKSF